MRILEQLKPLGLLFLRVALGIIFIFHGYPKLFTSTHQTMQFFIARRFAGIFRLYRRRAGIFRRDHADRRLVHAPRGTSACR